MTTTNFTINCDCGCSTGPLMTVSAGTLEAWKGVVAKGQISGITCPVCGCQYDPADNGQSIGQADKSKPRIDSISQTSGPVVGGTPVVLTGHALDYGQLVVRFNGVPALNLRNRSGGGATVDAPAGSYVLNGASSFIRRKLTCTISSGTFHVGNVVKGTTSNVDAIIREVGANFLYVDTWSGEFQAGEPIAEQVQGGATGSVVAFKSTLQVGESITGMTSGATAQLQLGFRVGVPTGVFQGGETILGGTSEAKFDLASPPTDGRVDVTVENEYGSRTTGGKLVNGFTYS